MSQHDPFTPPNSDPANSAPNGSASGVQPAPPKYLVIGGPEHPMTIWWAAHQPDRVHLTTGDPRFTDESGGRAGLRVVFSSNPRSADYNPGNFNRIARALAEAGIAAPEEVPVHQRHLRSRDQVIKDLDQQATAQQEATAVAAVSKQVGGATVSDPAEFGWATCPQCFCVVVSLDQHNCHLN